ncbi:MAG: histidine--tRNA ligase [Thermodesulfobacteriota bacterium]
MIQLIRGFKDILPAEAALWQHIEETARILFEDFGFQEIRPPIMERTELFKRSIGEETDIVEKEMYTFADRDGDTITLRPEATASIVRSYIQHKLYAADPIQKLYTIGPMFRRERPQKGRYRQFYQINAEVFGIESPLIDAQLIHMLTILFDRLAVKDVAVHLNSLGCPACRPGFRDTLTSYLDSRTEGLCENCRRRSSRNPMRVLDCKVPACREALTDAPAITDFLCPDCRRHFDTVQETLSDRQVAFTIDKRLVRGLDYYTRTTFEILTGSLGAQNAVAGGGRYNGLVEILGGPPLPGIGFAIGFDRLVEISAWKPADFHRPPRIFLAAMGEEAMARAYPWAAELSAEGIRTEMDLSGKNLKSMLKRADRLGSRHVLIIGENELAAGRAILRDMLTKEQRDIGLDGIVASLRSILETAAGPRE